MNLEIIALELRTDFVIVNIALPTSQLVQCVNRGEQC